MLYDQKVIQDAQRYAYKTLKNPAEVLKGAPKEVTDLYKVNPNNITSGAQIVQELPFVNTQNTYVFEFGTNAPNPTANLNNVVLGQNNVFAMYGVQLLIGIGFNGVSTLNKDRIYNSRGQLSGDYSLYTGQMAMQIESNTPVQKAQTLDFLETNSSIVYNFQQGQGLVLTNPQRLLTGRIATFQVIITLPPLAGTGISATAVLSCRLHGALGLA